jgi:hypothetical protein
VAAASLSRFRLDTIKLEWCGITCLLLTSARLWPPHYFLEFASSDAEQPVERAEGYSSRDKRYEAKPSPRRLGTNENQCNEDETDNDPDDSVGSAEVFAFAVHGETPFMD